jgi:hypothetical protein
LTSLDCFKDLSELLSTNRTEHKVLAIENSRLKLVSIYGEIKIVHEIINDYEGFPSQSFKKRETSFVKRFDQALKRFAEIVLGKVAFIENAMSQKLQQLG